MTDHRAVCSCGAELFDKHQVARALGKTPEAVAKAVSRGTLELPDRVVGGRRGVTPLWCAAQIGAIAAR